MINKIKFYSPEQYQKWKINNVNTEAFEDIHISAPNSFPCTLIVDYISIDKAQSTSWEYENPNQLTFFSPY